MPCYYPLMRVWSSSEECWKVKSFPKELRPGCDGHEFVYLKNRKEGYFPCPPGFPGAEEYQTIPCGKCVGCRMEYSRQWANRCMLELEYHESAYFVTLTYDDYHVPRSYYPDPDTGEAQLSLTLQPDDVTLFLKRLRKNTGQEFRYFYCGEYGPSTWRPHYHLIIFGLRLTDLTTINPSGLVLPKRSGYQYYYSATLQRAWSVRDPVYDLFGRLVYRELRPIGNISITDVTWETCAYTARYIMKKLKGPESKFYETFKLYPPFVRMSRMPGLARRWYEDHPGIDEFEYINLKTPKGGKKFRPPKYYHKLFDLDQPYRSEEMKAAAQRMCLNSIRAKLDRTDLSYLEYLAVEEERLKSKTKSLQRKDM